MRRKSSCRIYEMSILKIRDSRFTEIYGMDIKKGKARKFEAADQRLMLGKNINLKVTESTGLLLYSLWHKHPSGYLAKSSIDTLQIPFPIHH